LSSTETYNATYNSTYPETNQPTIKATEFETKLSFITTNYSAIVYTTPPTHCTASTQPHRTTYFETCLPNHAAY
jgi:hypothetical protein